MARVTSALLFGKWHHSLYSGILTLRLVSFWVAERYGSAAVSVPSAGADGAVIGHLLNDASSSFLRS
jgi:hypothetical protein